MTKHEISSKELIICSIVALTWDFFIWILFATLVVKYNWNEWSLLIPASLGQSPGSIYKRFKENLNDKN